MGRLTVHIPTAPLARAAANAGHVLATELLLERARALAPIDEHILEQSGAADVDTASLTASVSFDTPYARRQHEELTWRHDEGRTAKYLERPSIEGQPAFSALMAKAAKEVMR